MFLSSKLTSMVWSACDSNRTVGSKITTVDASSVIAIISILLLLPLSAMPDKPSRTVRCFSSRVWAINERTRWSLALRRVPLNGQDPRTWARASISSRQSLHRLLSWDLPGTALTAQTLTVIFNASLHSPLVKPSGLLIHVLGSGSKKRTGGGLSSAKHEWRSPLCCFHSCVGDASLERRSLF